MFRFEINLTVNWMDVATLHVHFAHESSSFFVLALGRGRLVITPFSAIQEFWKALKMASVKVAVRVRPFNKR